MSTTLLTFDPLTISLNGVSSIEASAGTGKTYGIASIYARLIVLENKHVDQILVVTFTNAAVAELKQRLRDRLIQIKHSLLGNNINIEPFIKQLIHELEQQNRDIPNIIRHLTEQINHFDEATIYTIHSFCLTVLKDEAFLSGSPFNLSLVSNHDEVVRTFTEDFFRENITPCNENSWFFFINNITPESLYMENRQWLQRPLIQKNFLNNLQKKQFQNNLLNIRQLSKNLHSQLNEDDIQAFLTILREKNDLSGTYFKLGTYETLFDMFRQSPQKIFSTLSNNKYLDACLRFKLNNQNFLKKTANKQKIQTLFRSFHCIISLAEQYKNYQDKKDEMIAQWYLEYIDYIDKRLEDYKKLTIERSFNDLLIDVLSIVNSDTSHTKQLIDNLNHQYHYVLIDEFQDTDPVQYTIFQKLFINNATPIFFIGDPKQSIYQFRGADVTAYLNAKKDATHFYTMNTNYRSVSPLVTFINKLFNSNSNPFKNENISYNNITAYRKDHKIIQKNNTLATLTIIRLNEEYQNKNKLSQLAADASANYIALLLNESQQNLIQYDNRVLEAKDIAILVNTHIQAQLVSNALLNKNIRSVKYEKESIYDTEEALILLSLLKFSRNLSYQAQSLQEIEMNYQELNYLLSSQFWNADAKEINEIQNSQKKLEYYLQQLKHFFIVWDGKGIYSAFQFLFQSIGVETRLIQQEQERSLTNFNQLIEILSEKEISFQNPNTLIKWFEDQIQKNNVPSDENTLRLESDENLVRIITIHASKGLQYPIVFCPFLWDYAEKKNQKPLLELDTSSEHSSPQLTYIKNINKAPQHAAQEAIRRLYVAITRAEEKLVLFTNDVEQDKLNADNPLQYLISPYLKESETLWDAWQNWYRTNRDLENIIDFQENLPNPTFFQNVQLNKPSFITIHKPNFQYSLSENTSYSRMIKNSQSPDLYSSQIDTQVLKQDLTNIKPTLNIFTFPKGSETGNLWHEILELINFQEPLSAYEPLIRKRIIQYGLHGYYRIEDLTKVTLEMIENTLKSKLNKEITLTNFSPDISSKELEFMFYQPNEVTLETINQWFKNNNLEKFIIPDTSHPQGKIYETYLSGFIDWVGLYNDEDVYIIDYKSNFMGNDLQDYTTDRLLSEVLKHAYQFQATIYALAMHRYFKSIQKPIKHIYIRYLFLRAVQKNSNKGIWKWDIDYQKIEDLETSLTVKAT
ncbi:MAG: exodeoxyribonuclease V subunit beta [Neisseriaceae bacterium]|nr:MAG: exodeoxyribonuclease V subunit beta [Neisseriaceae bacterium]